MLLLGPSLFAISSLVKDFKFNFTVPFFLGLYCFKVREGELMVVIVAGFQFCGVLLSKVMPLEVLARKVASLLQVLVM
jgi:hypothetical protein